MLLFIIITILVCIILYYSTSSTVFSFAAKAPPPTQKPRQPQNKPNKTNKPKLPSTRQQTQKPANNKQTSSKIKTLPPIKNQSTKKPPSTIKLQKPDKNGNCKSGNVNVGGNSCVPGYKPNDKGKCKSGDSLYNGNCFKPADISQYSKIQLIDMGFDSPMGFIRGKPIRQPQRDPTGGKSVSQAGKPVTAKLNGKQLNAVSVGSGSVAYLENGQVKYGTINDRGDVVPISSKARNPIIVLGIMGAIAAYSYLARQLSDPNEQAQIKNQIFAPLKGAGKMTSTDVTNLKLQTDKTYISGGKQYTIYKNGDQVTVGVMPCKGKCTSNVNANQATVLSTIAKPWATVGNAPVPGLTSDDMKAGKVYKTKDGKYYQVTADQKGFQQCSPKSNRSLEAEYRGGIGGFLSNLCGGRPTPANNLVEQAIGNFIMGPLAHEHLTYSAWGHIPQRQQQIANNFMFQNPSTTYGDYTLNVINSVTNTSEVPTVLSEDEFYSRRAQEYLYGGNRSNTHVYLPPNIIGNVIRTFGTRSLERIYGNNTFTNVVNTLFPVTQTAVIHTTEDLNLPTSSNEHITNTVRNLQNLSDALTNGSYNPGTTRNLPNWFNRVYNDISNNFLNPTFQNRPSNFDTIYRQRVAQMLLTNTHNSPQVEQYLASIAGNRVTLPEFILPSQIGSGSIGSMGSSGNSGGNIQYDAGGYAQINDGSVQFDKDGYAYISGNGSN